MPHFVWTAVHNRKKKNQFTNMLDKAKQTLESLQDGQFMLENDCSIFET